MKKDQKEKKYEETKVIETNIRKSIIKNNIERLRAYSPVVLKHCL